MTSHLTGHPEKERQIIESFTIDLLSQSKECGLIIEASESYPGNPLIQIYACMIQLYDMSQASFKQAEQLSVLLLQDRSSTSHVTSWVKVLSATSRKKFAVAIALLEDLTTNWPGDLLAFKFCEYLYFISGFKATNKRFLNHSSRLLTIHSNNGYFLGSHAFALSLNEQFEQAKQQGNSAVELAYTNPWAHHALAHAYLGSKDYQAGKQVMTNFQSNWSESGWPALCHNTWHLMLFQLATGEYQAVENTCFDNLWAGMLEHKFVHIDFDVISILWRLELYGHPTAPTRFNVFSDHLNAHLDNFVCGYQVAHSIYVLVKAGQSERVKGLLSQWLREGIDPSAYKFLHAINHFARGDFKEAADGLENLLPQIPSFGGSDGQIDLFYHTYHYCLLNSGQKSKANSFKKVWL